MKNKMIFLIIPVFFLILIAYVCPGINCGRDARAATLNETKKNIDTVETTVRDRKNIFVTIYNRNLALIKDKRKIRIPRGEVILEFKGVSGKIIPETAMLKSPGLKVLEQNFEFDLLTPQSLLKKFTGKKIKIIKTNPATGRERIVDAKVLSTTNGTVLKFDGGIETGTPGKIIFPYVPENLRITPTLTMLVKTKTKKARDRDMELSYLTRGLTWKADYIAKLNKKDNALDLKGWVTLTNKSRATYKDACLKLVAGDVNITRERRNIYLKSFETASPGRAPAEQDFSREQLFEYHMYTLNRKTTVKDNQTKQIALLNAFNVPCKKEFIIQTGGNSWYYRQHFNDSGIHLKTAVYIKFKNSEKNHLGVPIPKGIIRVYKEDKKGNLQFSGEDRIDHTPENAVVKIKLGNAFDISAIKKQTRFIKLDSTGYNSYKYQSDYEIKIMNSKSELVSIKIMVSLNGQWRIIKENFHHTKTDSTHAVWDIHVPAKGLRFLKYTVQIK